ncbi:hypothetical protein [Paenibacillus whitsoniae]|uniref:hypothetical protein n=1 Tax=Paenibacillus whitsoniae TaxID=2496558 RepID=UPI0013DFD3E9|nr:hypothetical protein [Paenibacillus whitsoniae]
MEMGLYQFADLDVHEELLAELRKLESRMHEELGVEIALIAYTKEPQEKSG